MTYPNRYRIPAAKRDALKAEFRRRYEAGESIRDLAASINRSYACARLILIQSGATLRSRGDGRWRTRRANGGERR